MGQLGSQANINVTLDPSESVFGDLANREFPCLLCGAGLPILTTKRKKPYFICNSCGVQVFVRGKKGISRLKEMAKSGILVSDKEESAMHGITLFNRLESLNLQKGDLQMKRGILGMIIPDENVENAMSLVDAEIKKIEGELANLAHKKEAK